MPSLSLRNPLRRDPNRPTLKERAATLKATAARLMRRPAPAAPAPAAEAPEEADWYNPPPGFMASPAIEPAVFTRIETGIRAEANRLLALALAEFRRRRETRQEWIGEAEWQAQGERLRKAFHLDALASIASPEHIEITGWRYVPEGEGSGRAAPHVAHAEAFADAELIAVGHAFDVAAVRERETNDAAAAAEARAEARMPERPACLFFRAEDAPFRLREHHSHPEALAGQPVTPRDLGWMTRRPAEREVWVDAPPGSKGSNMVPGRVPQIVPWPEAQARINEIEAAFKVWDLEKGRILEEEGSWDEDEAADRAGEATNALARRIAALPARTVEGIRVKLRVAAFYGVGEPDIPAGQGYTGEDVLRSLYRDTPGIEISTDPSDIRIVPEAMTAEDQATSLSDQIIACWREWAACCGPDETDADRERWERIAAQRDDLLDAAEALPPTLESLPAKALALVWLEYVQQWERGREREAYDITGGLAVDIDTAIVGRFRLAGHFRGA